MQTTYSPEGAILHTQENAQYLATLDDMRRAMREGAILEAVAFTLKDDLACIGANCDEIRITGGGASSPLWAQIKADVTGIRLSTLMEKESACLGTAILAGVGCGVYDSVEKACQKIIRTKKTYVPGDTDYTVPYRQYKKLESLLNNPEDIICQK